MSKIFCSRLQFTLLGAPVDAFFIDLVQSVDVRDLTGITPFVPLNTLAKAQSFTTYHESVQIRIVYKVLDNAKTFDFKLLPYGIVNVQLSLYKEREVVGIASGVWLDSQSFAAPKAGNPATVTLLFDAINFTYNFIL